MPGVSFGIATAPQQVDYRSLLRVWRDADEQPEIEHAWLFDHLFPIAGDRRGPIFEGWTLLSALAALTSRLRVGVLVTSNRIRPPALLGKIATTVDIVSDGRLEFGLGVGSRPDIPWAREEYDAHGLGYEGFGDAVDALAESCEVLLRLWTEPEPFDYDGRHVHLVGAFGNPKPVQQPHPPLMIGGRSARTLRVVARYADRWNVPGADLEDAAARSALLDRYCADVGRDPATVTRSVTLGVSYEDPDRTREAVSTALDQGFTHVVLGLAAPYPEDAARWVAQRIIRPSMMSG